MALLADAENGGDLGEMGGDLRFFRCICGNRRFSVGRELFVDPYATLFTVSMYLNFPKMETIGRSVLGSPSLEGNGCFFAAGRVIIYLTRWELGVFPLLKIGVIGAALIVVVLGWWVFPQPLETRLALGVSGLLAIGGVLREQNLSQQTLLALDLLFMLLVLVIFSLNGRWTPDETGFFLFFFAVSLAAGSLEGLLFGNRKEPPALGLLWIVLFWAPLAVPVFYIVYPKGQWIGSFAALAVLFVIAVRDLTRRKKEKFRL